MQFLTGNLTWSGPRQYLEGKLHGTPCMLFWSPWRKQGCRKYLYGHWNCECSGGERETYITTYQVPREIVRLPLIQEGLTHLRTCARVSVTALHRLNRPSSRCGSSLRNFTASTSTRRTTRILLCRLGKLAAMPGMGRKGRERHGGQSRPKAGFHLGGKGGMEPRREAGGRDGEAQVSEKWGLPWPLLLSCLRGDTADTHYASTHHCISLHHPFSKAQPIISKISICVFWITGGCVRKGYKVSGTHPPMLAYICEDLHPVFMRDSKLIEMNNWIIEIQKLQK